MTPQHRPWTDTQKAALEHAWGEYRTWAITSRARKKQVTNWRLRVLVLTILGAVLATAGDQLAGGDGADQWWRFTPGIAAGIALALAAFFSREALGEDQVKQWVRARSTAEALKAETYLFRAGVPPYNGPDDGKRLTEAVAGIEKNVEDLPAVTIGSDAKRERLPDGPLTIDAYIKERVDEAVDGFYVPRASEHERLAGRIRTISVSLGAAAAVLGVFSAAKVAAWVAVVTTVMAALAAYLYAQRYQYLITSYQAAARRLASLKTEWLVSGKTESDTRERTEYIRAFEETISVENSAWMAKLPEKKLQ